ncbi:NOT2 family protein [Westerdykella ornata]|uniref:NOT2 family protein n=1 Tax=Westerdykella ornata TaxID=318751 RepID=A0A6A6JL64_WESOR|nr:NOT2 family protein [Westerdykella ornata]KAF2275649.1 NOT2 family protein [Westerdykella ornata]
MFQSQQTAAARGGPLGSNRLQNGKLGGGSQWAFGQLGGAPGLSNAQSRTNGSGLSSFAQTISNSRQHASLNPEEFPSLSGTPQAQHNTSAQQMWSNPSLRVPQHSTIQRPQIPTPSQNQPAPTNNQLDQMQSHLHEDGHRAGQAQYPTGGDDFRFGGQAGVGQLSGGGQPQTGNIEEFPPLGGGAGEVGPDRRTGMIQNAAAYAGNGSNTFPGLGPTRNGLSSPTEGQHDRTINNTLVGRSGHPGPSNDRQVVFYLLNVIKGDQVTGQTMGNLSMANSQIPIRGGNPGGQAPQPHDQNFAAGTASPGARLPQHKKLADMSESERYSLPGLLAMIPLESPDHSSLAMGQDLTVLGLDLSRPENSPLYPTFGSPFVEANVKPVVPKDFHLPAAYTVTNVPPLHMKMQQFHWETLMAIFYQYPRDILQEMAANELYNRDWRWHMKYRQWMMKDPELQDPVQISPREEHGWYLFFDVTNWRRERRECDLNYDDLDQRYGGGARGVPHM